MHNMHEDKSDLTEQVKKLLGTHVFLSGDDNLEPLIDGFIKPLREKHTLGVESAGLPQPTIVFNKSQFYTTPTIHVEMTKEHTTAYLERLKELLSCYDALVQRNSLVNPHYKPPIFKAEQAVEMANQAFEDSLRKTANSYSVKIVNQETAYKSPV